MLGLEKAVSYCEAGLALAAESDFIDNKEGNLVCTPRRSH